MSSPPPSPPAGGAGGAGNETDQPNILFKTTNTVSNNKIINIIICKIFTRPRSLVFLNNSRSCPRKAVKPAVEPLEDNNSPKTIAMPLNTITKTITQFITHII
jgi:hypothetical protein